MRKQESREVAGPAHAFALWDPFRLMREVMRWDTDRDMQPLGLEIGFAPSFDVKETKDAYLFRADLPGVKEENVEVSLTGNRLTISGHREEEQKKEGEQYYATEIRYGSFTRSFTLPDGTDAENIKAEMRDGVLTVTIPKKPEVQPRTIPIAKQQLQLQTEQKAQPQIEQKAQPQTAQKPGAEASWRQRQRRKAEDIGPADSRLATRRAGWTVARPVTRLFKRWSRSRTKRPPGGRAPRSPPAAPRLCKGRSSAGR